MDNFAIFVTFKAKPGMRNNILEVYNRLVKPNAQKSDDLLTCSYNYSIEDENTIHLFEVHSKPMLLEEANIEPWFKQYMEEMGQFLAEPPTMITMKPIWNK